MNAAKPLSPEHIESILRVTPIYPEFATARVACPHCGAGKGEQCISSSVPRLHVARTDSAKDEMRRLLAEETV